MTTGFRRTCTALAMLASLLAAACTSETQPPPSPAAHVDGDRIIFPARSSQLAALKLASASEGDGTVHRLTGRIVWDEEHTVRVYTPFAGRIEIIRANVADHVQAKQILALIGSPDFGQAQAEVHKAQADFSLAEKNRARQRELFDHGVVAAKDMQSAEADYQRAAAELARVRSRAALYGGDSMDQRFPLRTPLPGVVVEKNINPGQEVRPDQLTSNMPPLFVITDPAQLWAQLDATEHDLASLRRGQTVILRTPAYPDEAFPARIESIADFIDPTSRVIRIRATVNNATRKLKGEMFVIAEIRDEGRPALMIPAASTFLVGAKHYTFVEVGDGQFARIEVSIGKEVNGWVAVTSGIEVGQRVVSSGALQLEQILENGKSAESPPAKTS
ncbi:MAG TPA: efflux RND transporter periplasmic adaptor subunit [Casimicrobiaceae bacterium]|jgi:cobalt-zinc-cadmium efflux system membrane fusion protein|nr:efflux RND transporter periplasmic adaptor subunit [Casimicrobiaceae bacterium]